MSEPTLVARLLTFSAGLANEEEDLIVDAAGYIAELERQLSVDVAKEQQRRVETRSITLLHRRPKAQKGLQMSEDTRPEQSKCEITKSDSFKVEAGFCKTHEKALYYICQLVSKEAELQAANQNFKNACAEIARLENSDELRKHVVELETTVNELNSYDALELQAARRERDQAKHAFDMLQHDATESNRVHNEEMNRMSEELQSTKARVEELDRLKASLEIQLPDFETTKHTQGEDQLAWLEAKVKQLQGREQLIHELGRGYAEPKLENRKLRDEIAKLREALTEAQEYAEHQSRDCRELSHCVCGYQAWWEKAEAALPGATAVEICSICKCQVHGGNFVASPTGWASHACTPSASNSPTTE